MTKAKKAKIESAVPDARTAPAKTTRDRPWLIRTYSGHSSANASNEGETSS